VSDSAFMGRALDLAEAMRGRTGENPAVGCVVVKNGAVIAEAATAETGRPHAEEQALAGIDAEGADVFVTLEPCAQRSTGAPSCTDHLIAARVARVVIAARDPHPLANGAGLDRLRAAGIAVEVGEGDARALAINADFLARWA